MNFLTKCQIAELIEDSLIAQGFKGKTAPFLWSSMIFGSLFESNVPMETMSLRDKKSVRVHGVHYVSLCDHMRMNSTGRAAM